MILDPNTWLATLYDLDPGAFTALSPYHSQIFALTLIDADKTFVFLVSDGGFQTIQKSSDDCSLTISATAASLLQLVVKKPPLSQLNISITGDERFGQTLMECLTRYQGRPSDWLADKIGDAPVNFAKHLIKKAHQQIKPPIASVYQQSMDYMVYETDLLAPKPAVDDFSHAVDNLVLDVERLEAKIDSLFTPAQE